MTCELYEDPRSQQEFMFLVKDWFSKLTGSRCSHQKTGSENLPQTGSSQIQAKVSSVENIQIDKNRHAHWNSSSESENSPFASEQTCTQKTATDSLTGSRLSATEQTGTLNTATNSTTGSSLFECFSSDSVTQLSVQISSDISITQDFGSKLDTEQTTNECSEMPESYNNDRNVGKSAEKSEKREFCSSLETPQLCMVGLHCCGDLTPTMLKYFVELDAVTSLCCISCCYHRMKFSG